MVRRRPLERFAPSSPTLSAQFMERKLAFNRDLRRYVNELQKTKPVIWSGDFNSIAEKLGAPPSSQALLPNQILTITLLLRRRESGGRLGQEARMPPGGARGQPGPTQVDRPRRRLAANAPQSEGVLVGFSDLVRGRVELMSIPQSHTSVFAFGWRLDGFIVSRCARVPHFDLNSTQSFPDLQVASASDQGDRDSP